jgi:hypothetical protein
VTASPAAASGCNSGTWYGPYWWASEYVSRATGEIKVLATTPPWDTTSTTYIWTDNGSDNQRWFMECIGTGLPGSWYKLHLASDKNACLSDDGQGNPATLDPCDAVGTTSYYWKQTVSSFGDSTFTNYSSGRCLDLFGANTATGAAVGAWPCNNGTNQLWF